MIAVHHDNSVRQGTTHSDFHLPDRIESCASADDNGEGYVRRVGFRDDVHIRKIPGGKLKPGAGSDNLNSGRVRVQRESPPSDPDEADRQARTLLETLDGVSCFVSTSVSDQHLANNKNSLYGLHALNNLDMAVNGRVVNAMTSYRDLRRRETDEASITLHSRASSAGATMHHHHQQQHHSHQGHSSHRSEQPSYYARPAVATPASMTTSNDSSVSGEDKWKRHKIANESNNDDSAIASGGDNPDGPDANYNDVYYASAFRPPARSASSPPTVPIIDALRSPAEVLYAVSDKRKKPQPSAPLPQRASAAVQAGGFRQGFFAKNPHHRRTSSSSREDLARASPVQHRMISSASTSAAKRALARRDLDRDHDDGMYRDYRDFDDDDEDEDKENAFRTRIQVVSPERMTRGATEPAIRRKPYKTTINTATDNIQYRIDGTHDEDPEHYKVPRNGAPLSASEADLFRRRRRRANVDNHDPFDDRSDASSSFYGPAFSLRSSAFASTGLVKRADAAGRRPQRRGAAAADFAHEPEPGNSYVRRRESVRRTSGGSSSPERDSHHRQPQQHFTNSASPVRPPRSSASTGRLPYPSLRRPSPSAESDRARLASLPAFPATNARIRRATSSQTTEADSRLANFTEYRGYEDSATGTMTTTRSSGNVSDRERERGRSLPPAPAQWTSMPSELPPHPPADNRGTTTRSRSMYALPPSPTRPAPILDRNRRYGPSGVGRHAGLSDGDVTDEGSAAFTNAVAASASAVATERRRPSTKRPAPAPPPQQRRIDEPSSSSYSNSRRPLSSGPILSSANNTLPSSRRVRVRRSSVDGQESSFSESEGVINVDRSERDKRPGDFGRRWSAHQASDVDSDYRREMATQGNSLHHEARSRDGGFVDMSYPSQEFVDYPQPSPSSQLGKTSTREEERRKVLEIEEDRVRREREAQMRRAASGTAVSATSTNTLSGRTAHVHSAALRRGGGGAPRQPPLSSASVNEASRLSGTTGPGAGVRVRRTASSATNSLARPSSGVATGSRGAAQTRRRLPGGSLTSSVNSSESEQGSAAASRATEASRRSVYLHAAAVADIPSASDRLHQRAQSAESGRVQVPHAPPPSQVPASAPAPAPAPGTLKGSQKISRSISLLAPWKPKNYRDRFEVIHYDNTNVYAKPVTSVTVSPAGPLASSTGKPPRPPMPQMTATVHRDKKSASSHDLLADTAVHMPPPERRTRTLQRPTPSKVSRSVSMPKDSRLAGWFKKRKRT